MKQIETINYKKILSTLNFYREIGVDLSINQNEEKQKQQELIKNYTNIESDSSIIYPILNEEKKAYNISITAKNIKELERVFEFPRQPGLMTLS